MWVAESETTFAVTGTNIHALLTTPVPAIPVKQHFCKKNHEQADSRGAGYFTDKVDEVAKLQPFNQYQIEMMYKTEYAYIQRIGCPTHTFMAGFNITLFGGFLGYQQVQQERPDICDQYTGSGV